MSKWMAQLDGTKKLSEFTIPGTHDSCALIGGLGDFAKCQSMSLEDQLKSGVRFVDIRCRHIDNLFAIHHGMVYQKLMFDNVLETCIKFLQENSSECIIMSVKEEYESHNCTNQFHETFSSYVQKNRFIWYLEDTIPTLDKVRGKIVLIRRFVGSGSGIDANPWADNAIFEINNNAKLKIQDVYHIDSPWGTISDKWNKIQYFLDEAQKGSKDVLYINYASAEQIPLNTQSSIASEINSKFIFNNDGLRLGIIATDFCNSSLNAILAQTNSPYKIPLLHIGGHKTKSSPFVSGDWVYFQGTDDKLWKIKNDGSGTYHIGAGNPYVIPFFGCSTKSSPFVAGDYVYFQGMNDGLCKVKNDGTGYYNIGGHKTKSSPFVSGDWVYFQGTDDKLWKIKNDGSSNYHIGGHYTKATPFVAGDWVYFQGTDDKLWKIKNDGSSNYHIGGHYTEATPFVAGDYIYFQGTDDKLWRRIC